MSAMIAHFSLAFAPISSVRSGVCSYGHLIDAKDKSCWRATVEK
jgi:hypothetical protein